jgi:hypothetical protein
MLESQVPISHWSNGFHMLQFSLLCDLALKCVKSQKMSDGELRTIIKTPLQLHIYSQESPEMNETTGSAQRSND